MNAPYDEIGTAYRCWFDGDEYHHDTMHDCRPPDGDTTLRAWVSKVGGLFFGWSRHSLDEAERVVRSVLETDRATEPGKD